MQQKVAAYPVATSEVFQAISPLNWLQEPGPTSVNSPYAQMCA